MQIMVQDASELFMAITLVIGAVILVNYTRKRTAELSPEEKADAGRPLYFSATGIVVLAIASLYNFLIELETSSLIINGTYYVLTIIAATFFAIAALMILDYKKAIGISILTTVVGVILTYLIAILNIPIALGMMAGPISLVMNLIPIGLFIYLARKTGRITAIALAFLLVTYLIFPITTVSTDPSIIAALIGIRLLGPALIIIAFLKPELGISMELFGYSISVNIIAFWFSYALAIGIADVELFIGVAMISIVSLLGFTLGTYTFSRYRVSRNNATGLIGVYFFTAGVSHIIIALSAIGVLTGATNAYLSAIIGIVGMMFFNLSAFIALDWRRSSLLPILLIIPTLVYMAISFPADLATVYAYNDISGTTNIIQILVPVGLYTMLWRRMKKADILGRNRPLSLSIGLILLVVAGIVAQIISGNSLNVVAIAPASIILSAFALFLAGITGYADKWLGTAKPEE